MNFGGISAPKLSPVDMALIPPEKLTEIEKEYSTAVFQLLSGKLEKPLEDPRFQSQLWHEGWSSFIYQTYLINAKHLISLAEAVENN